MAGAIGVAYITYGLKKSGKQNSAEICSRLDNMDKRLDSLDQKSKEQESFNLIEQGKLQAITNDLEDNNLRTLRLDLLHAIETDPDNQVVILELAQKYFVEMKGNCYMSKVFQEWADDHNVSITSLFNK